jgi:hypothetical protein
MPSLTQSASIVIARSPQDLYNMISDITRMGEFSPVCRACWWDEGAGPSVGSWFTGRNEAPGRDPWQTRCQVLVADPGREFAFAVNGNGIRWGYTFEPADGGTRVTEAWNVLPAGVDSFESRFGEHAAEQLANRYDTAHASIPATLTALKRLTEG